MSSSTFAGNPDVMVAGPPPPPPPPPPVSGQLPAMRINTVEPATMKRPQTASNDTYEPPAAIQNAMLTKDKKPFTYTPGMGGKLDLSQIRSPRMARRVAKNANDEGIEGPPKPAVDSKPSPAASTAPNLFVQPQVAVPVFPTNISPQPNSNRIPQPTLVNRTPSNAVDKQAETSKNITKIDTKVAPITITSNQSSAPESPNTPTQITLAKAPTPWLQNRNKSQEELPEWAKRASVAKATGGPSEIVISPTVYAQNQQSQQSSPQLLQMKQKDQEQPPIQISPQYQQGQPKSQSFQQSCPPPSRQQRQNTDSATSQRTNPQTHQHERVIPIRIEDRPSVFDAKREPGHHQFKQSPTLHHQQRWGQVQQPPENRVHNRLQNQEQSQTHVATLSQPEQSVGTYIIPLVVEGNDKKTPPSNIGNNATGKTPKVLQQRTSVPIQQHETGPIQSRSFRVLQKITDTDTSNDVGTEQIRKMELSEDERELMNKFKEQVDHETYLHQEEDPRYRGAAIPSRAFRFLQNMTDSTDASVTCLAPRNAQNVSNKKQNRNSKSFEETQANLPPSEQQVPEPKKYMGSAIPSRSFRILQAMTAPESIATQENRQADYTCQTENNLPGNQQGAFLSPPVPFWHPEGWWDYYPMRYSNALSNDSINETDKRNFPSHTYPRYPDGSVYIGYEFFCPLYDRNFADSARIDVTRRENLSNEYDRKDSNDVRERDRLTADLSLAQNDNCFVKNGSINQSESTVLPNEINHLDAQSNGIYSSRCTNESGNNDEHCVITAMNIVDEEDSTTDSFRNSASSSKVKTLEKTFGLQIDVPNYTYIDTSDSSASSDSSDSSDSNDSSDSGDSSDSISDSNEHLSNSRQKDFNRSNNTTSNNTSSDSDSDSYVAYSTGVSSHEKLERDSRKAAITTDNNSVDIATYSELVGSADTDNCGRSINDNSESNTHGEKIRSRKDRFETHSDDRNSPNTLEEGSKRAMTKGYNEDYTDDRDNFDSRSTKTSSNDIVPHRLSVIYEDTERPDSEGPYYDGKRNIIVGRNEASFEATDDPPDEEDSETTMVSVSLPLRFKFFVSEDNEDITTVIVGDSRVKAEKTRDTDSRYSTEEDKVDDVCVNFHIGNDTSIDFTIKEHANSNDTRDTSSTENETANAERAIPCTVNFTLRKDFTKVVNRISREEHAEMKFTTKERERIDSTFDLSSIDDRVVSEFVSMMDTQDTSLKNEKNCNNNIANFTCNNFADNIDLDRMIDESKIVSAREDFEARSQIRVVNGSNDDQTERKNCAIAHNKDDRCIDPEFCSTNAKRSLSAQDSRDNTDDEDSGVTSDISRMISEVDTDSECASARNLKKYQRTQTHSRLFRLLNDDAVLSDCLKTDSSSKKEYLSLPLKNVFNYDDSYCSNYSSGLTSPEYSPIYEQSWRKFHDTTNTIIADSPSFKIDHPTSQQLEQVSYKDDSYFRTWKSPKSSGLNEHDIVPSLAFKILDSKIPSWAYKVNVLCPRIKSTKNVPQALFRDCAQSPQTGKINDDPLVVPSIPTSCENAKTNYC